MIMILKNTLSKLLFLFSSGEKLTKLPPLAIVKKPLKRKNLVGKNSQIHKKKKMSKLLDEVILHRDEYKPEGTTGTLKTIDDEFICLTLEEPWKDNKRGVSCIPEGRYLCTRYQSPKLIRAGKSDPEVILLHNVENRSFVQIHVGNTLDDIEGCIMTGEAILNGFRYKGKKRAFFILKSFKAFKKLKKITAPEFYLTVKGFR